MLRFLGPRTVALLACQGLCGKPMSVHWFGKIEVIENIIRCGNQIRSELRGE